MMLQNSAGTVFFPLSSFSSPLSLVHAICLHFTRGILLSLLRNVRTHKHTHEHTHNPPPPPCTHTQITPRPVLSNIPPYKESKHTCTALRPDTVRSDKGGWRKKNKYSTAAFLTESELLRPPRLLLLLPPAGLSISLQKCSQRKEKERERKNTSPPLSCAQSPRPAGFLSLLCAFPK